EGPQALLVQQPYGRGHDPLAAEAGRGLGPAPRARLLEPHAQTRLTGCLRHGGPPGAARADLGEQVPQVTIVSVLRQHPIYAATGSAGVDADGVSARSARRSSSAASSPPSRTAT